MSVARTSPREREVRLGLQGRESRMMSVPATHSAMYLKAELAQVRVSFRYLLLCRRWPNKRRRLGDLFDERHTGSMYAARDGSNSSLSTCHKLPLASARTIARARGTSL